MENPMKMDGEPGVTTISGNLQTKPYVLGQNMVYGLWLSIP